jgi:F-type H+-transporting ATPase subunit alpha
MKAVAGTLRLDLAQYREKAAFAQFGSDLDPATQKQLARGQRLMELLKQPQYTPMEFSDQVFVIYAANSGALDTMPVAKVKEFEGKFLKHLHSIHGDIVKDVLGSGKLEPSVKAKLDEVIKDFLKNF